MSKRRREENKIRKDIVGYEFFAIYSYNSNLYFSLSFVKQIAVALFLESLSTYR